VAAQAAGRQSQSQQDLAQFQLALILVGQFVVQVHKMEFLDLSLPFNESLQFKLGALR
jgi:hypothetical protein